MADVYEEKLREILIKHGEAAKDPEKLRAMLLASFPNKTKETNILVNATEVGLVDDLKKHPRNPFIIVAYHTWQLEERFGYREDLAQWATLTWAGAMDVQVFTKDEGASDGDANKGIDIDKMYDFAEAFFDSVDVENQDLNHYEKVIELLDKILDIDPKYAKALNLKGGVLYASNRSSDAIKYYNAAIEQEPTNKIFWNNKATAYFDLNQFDKAIMCLDAAITLDHEFSMAYVHKAIVLVKLGRAEEAEKLFQKAKEIEDNMEPEEEEDEEFEDEEEIESRPMNVDEWYRSIVKYHESVAKDKQDNEYYLKVLSQLDEILEDFPDYRDALNYKGLLLYMSGQPQEALTCFDKLLKNNPVDKEVWNNKAVTLYGMERDEEALTCVDAALDVDDRYADAYRNRGVILQKLGRIAEANESLAKAEALGNDN